jgi:hypothetical protein
MQRINLSEGTMMGKDAQPSDETQSGKGGEADALAGIIAKANGIVMDSAGSGNADMRSAGSGASDVVSVDAGDADNASEQTHFDVNEFLAGLDAIFDAHDAGTKAEPYLQQALVDAENAEDHAGLLTVLNETMGFYRSQGRHDDNQWIIQRAIELGLRMGLQGSEAWTTTLINAATGMRAARQYDQAEDLYRQALDNAARTLPPTDRRMAALHNNLSMLYSETKRLPQAREELETALHILDSASVDASVDIDAASTHTNLALVLLQEAQAATQTTNAMDDAAQTAAAKDADSTAQREEQLASALDHASQALHIYRTGHLEHSAHYASALAGYAQVCFALGRFAEAVQTYQRSLAVIAECYGTDTDYYRITEANLKSAQEAAEQTQDQEAHHAAADDAGVSSESDRGHSAECSKSADRNEIFAAAEAPETVSSKIGAADDHANDADNNESNESTDGLVTSASSDAQTSQQVSHQTADTASSHQSARQNSHRSSRSNHSDHQPAGQQTAIRQTADRQTATQQPHTVQPRERISGLRLARAYWNEYGKPLLAELHPEYRGRIAAGLVGHGSECYGFDDEFSQDHDFGPGFCLWLADDDYARIGERLQANYDALPKEFMGYGPRESTARAGGASRRVGVFAIGDFFERLTGYRQAPAASKPHEWLLLDEATLAATTNGEVFADPLGMFLKTRQGFKMMPEDVRLALISRRLGMIAQAGQYNLPRMLDRGDGAAAWLSINEFANACCSLVFLINQPVTVGYLPYYKWRFAALRKLSRRMATRLADVCEQLETILRLSSAACFGGAGFGEGGKGSGPAQGNIQSIVSHICAGIVHELNADGLSDSSEPFLEWQRPYVEEHIESDAAVLHSL